MNLTDSYKSHDLKPGVILTNFLIFGRFLGKFFSNKQYLIIKQIVF